MTLNELAKQAHKIAISKGFWEDKRLIPECLMLCVTELAEACEKDRYGDMEGFNEEIADTFIRLLDLCCYLNIDIEDEIRKKMEINKNRSFKHGKRY